MTSNNYPQDISQDRGRPEPVLFLSLAADAFTTYHQAHGEYPKEWFQLDFTFVNGPYHMDEPDIRASKADGNRWKPLKCEYTYEIKFSGRDTFHIQAINPRNSLSCQIRNGMDEPVININEENIFHEYYRPVLRAVIDELKKNREDPSEFYASVESQGPNQAVVHLWHQDAFKAENLGIVGNPGGRCRDFYYDMKQKKITKKLGWQ